MIEGIVTGDREVAARFRRIPDQVKVSLRKSIARIIIRLQSKIVREKLQGQVLKVRTGTLQRSIDQVMLDIPHGASGVVWTNVEYARRHEYGFQGTESVKEHLRMMTQAFGREVKNPRKIAISAHSRAVNYPAHSFMRTALRESAPEIQAQIERAVSEGLH